MPPSLSELKVTPSFCFAFKIPDDVTATIENKIVAPIENILSNCVLDKKWLTLNLSPFFSGGCTASHHLKFNFVRTSETDSKIWPVLKKIVQKYELLQKGCEFTELTGWYNWIWISSLLNENTSFIVLFRVWNVMQKRNECIFNSKFRFSISILEKPIVTNLSMFRWRYFNLNIWFPDFLSWGFERLVSKSVIVSHHIRKAMFQKSTCSVRKAC